MVDRYIFPAVIYPPEQEGLDYCVVFPDLDVATQGETLEQALDMAKELLELTIFGLEEDGDQIPVASDPATLGIEQPGAFTTLIVVNMPMVRTEMDLQLKLDSSDPPVYVSEKQEHYLPEDD